MPFPGVFKVAGLGTPHLNQAGDFGPFADGDQPTAVRRERHIQNWPTVTAETMDGFSRVKLPEDGRIIQSGRDNLL